MPIQEMIDWIANTELSTAIREGGLPYPILGGIHLLGIAIFGGMVSVTNLRLLGIAMPTRPIADVVEQLRWWKRLGLAVMLTTGGLLAWSEPMKLQHNPAFFIKVTLLAMLGVHALVFRGLVHNNAAALDKEPATPTVAKVAGATSLLLWACVVIAGRLIAFED